MVGEYQYTIEAINLYQTQYGLVDALWGYFSVVTLAVAGFVLSSDKATKSVKEPIAIVGAYLVFCIGNHSALVEGQKQLHQLSKLVIEVSKDNAIDLSSFIPPEVCYIRIFHASVVAVVCIGILVIARLRQATV